MVAGRETGKCLADAMRMVQRAAVENEVLTDWGLSGKKAMVGR